MQAAYMKILCDLTVNNKLSLQKKSFPGAKGTNTLLYFSQKLTSGVIEIPGT